MLAQHLDASISDAQAACALELKWLGDDADGENAQFPSRPGNNGSSPGARAATHAGGDKHHMRADDVASDFFDRLFSGGLADFGLGAGP